MLNNEQKHPNSVAGFASSDTGMMGSVAKRYSTRMKRSREAIPPRSGRREKADDIADVRSSTSDAD